MDFTRPQEALLTGPDTRAGRRGGRMRRVTLEAVLAGGALLCASLTAISYAMANEAQRREAEELSSRTHLLIDLVEASQDSLHQRLDTLTRELQGRLAQAAPGSTGRALSRHARRAASAVSTDATIHAAIYERDGQDFAVIGTWPRHDNDAQAWMAALASGQPAHAGLLAGAPYTSSMRLQGRPYMVRYAPWLRDNGQVGGATLVAIDYSELENRMKSLIRNMAIGQGGYYFVLDARAGGDWGRAIVHPHLEGRLLRDLHDADGAPYVREILDRREGIVRYRSPDAAGSSDGADHDARPQLAAFSYLPRWDWIIVATYGDGDLGTEAPLLRDGQLLLWTSLCLTLMALLATIWRLRRARSRRRTASLESPDTTSDPATMLAGIYTVTPGDPLLHAIRQVSTGMHDVVRGLHLDAVTMAATSGELITTQQELMLEARVQREVMDQAIVTLDELARTATERQAELGDTLDALQEALQAALQGTHPAGPPASPLTSYPDLAHKAASLRDAQARDDQKLAALTRDLVHADPLERQNTLCDQLGATAADLLAQAKRHTRRLHLLYAAFRAARPAIPGAAATHAPASYHR